MGKVFKGINVANSDKKIDATATRTGADGTGYYQGSDGRYYYGNPQNGYLTETEQSKAYRAREEGVPSQLGSSRPAYNYNASAPSSGSGSFLDRVAEFVVCSVLTVKILFWVLSFLAIFAALSALFFGTLYSWPFLPGQSTGMIIFGAFIAALGVLFGFMDGGTLFITVNLVLEGTLLAAMGILYKVK